MEVYQGEMFGVQYKYVVSPNGYFLYEQKRSLSCKAWVKMICKGLLSRGFSWEKIEEKWNDMFNKNNYFNSKFYRPVWQMIQEQIDLSV